MLIKSILAKKLFQMLITRLLKKSICVRRWRNAVKKFVGIVVFGISLLNLYRVLRPVLL